jgi:hypothetical protein
VNGAWGAAHYLPGEASVFDSGADAVSCPAPGYCAAGGWLDTDAAGHPLLPFTSSEATPSATTLTLSRTLPLSYGNEQAEQVTVTVSSAAGGTPTGTVTVQLGSTRVCTITLSAGAGTCHLGATAVPAGAFPVTAAYPGDASFFGSAAPALAPLTVAKAASKTSLTLARASVRYGHEGAERLSVTVSPQYAGVPAGHVTIKAGQTVLCTITLSSGKGSCALTASKLKPGSYVLVAIYAGSGNFAWSSAPAKTLKVTR